MGSTGIVVRTKSILVVGSGDQRVFIQPTTLLPDVTAAEPLEMDDGDEEFEQQRADRTSGSKSARCHPGDDGGLGGVDPGPGR